MKLTPTALMIATLLSAENQLCASGLENFGLENLVPNKRTKSIMFLESADPAFKKVKQATPLIEQEKLDPETGVMDYVKDLLHHINHTLTPLMVAAMHGYQYHAEDLIIQGADVNSARADGVTALYIAAQKGHTGVVETLLTHKADVHQATWLQSITPLMIATFLEHTDVVRTLLTRNVEMIDQNQATRRGNTALHIAAGKGNIEILEILLAHPASIDQQNCHGKTALMIAAQKNQKESIRILLANGANVNKTMRDGKTALMIAQENGYEKVVSMLKKAGAH